MTATKDQQTLASLAGKRDQFFQEICRVIVGQQEVLNHILIALLCQGHSLLVGVPGLAKTLMIKSLAELLDLKFSRIQFTPDLMPSDITGTDILEENAATGKREFRFVQGPVFGHIILADEINRTPPKTQSALLEAMQEHKVTAAGMTYTLEEPFFVLATQNPIEQEGTYPLPEAQLDRFMFNLTVDYPNREEEVAIVNSTTAGQQNGLKKVISRKELLAFQELIHRIPVAPNVVEYAVDLVGATRPHQPEAPEYIRHWVEWGAGPRASQYLILGAKARAALEGRPSPDIRDVQALVLPVLRHRVLLNFNAESEGKRVEDILTRLLEDHPAA
ncbi:MAG: MoxR family ATPase [Candidatus Neomarinimicrobiota bacterium]|nr:MAG: MoxR family ATPase [Candidatus Neomarinimicrobiota bacterium]